MLLTKKSVAVSENAVCFGCNQSFQGNPLGVQFESELVPAQDRAELAGLFFHPGHLIRFARRRDWKQLAEYLESNGASKF